MLRRFCRCPSLGRWKCLSGIRTKAYAGDGDLACVGLLFRGGSRRESLNGVAHLLEHCAFRGSRLYSQSDLVRAVENRGACLDAFTTREGMAFISRSLRRDVPDMLEILNEVAFHATLYEQTTKKEKTVVLQEAESVAKDPREALADRMHRMCFPSSNLGRSILGTNSSLSSIRAEHLRDFRRENFVPSRMFVVGCGLGKEGASQFRSMVHATIEHGHELSRSSVWSRCSRRLRRVPIAHPFVGGRFSAITVPRTQFASLSSPFHFMVCFEGFHANDLTKSLSALILSHILDSRLKESSGPDSLNAFVFSYEDTGLWGSFGSGTVGSVQGDLSTLSRQWRRLWEERVPEQELEAAKATIITKFASIMGDSCGMVDEIARYGFGLFALCTQGSRLRQFFSTGRVISSADMIKAVASVSVKDLQRAARLMLLEKRPSLAVWGDVDDCKSFSSSVMF